MREETQEAPASFGLDWELESKVHGLEQAWRDGADKVDFHDFLPDTDHPRFNKILLELVRVDAELAIQAGYSRTLGYYQALFPAFAHDNNMREQLEFELSRISTGQKEIACHNYPQVGESICGFELLAVIGHGAFSCVYLAAETELSQRLVALKLSTNFPGEAGTLAKLQHKNIVPIYSWHRYQSFYVVCMPYFGSTTLFDFLKFRSPTANSLLGEEIVSTLNRRRSQTLAEVSVSKSKDPSLPQRSASSIENLSREIPRLLSGQSSHDTLLWIAKELSEGLIHAHERGVLHRDIKPANVLLSNEGIPMLLDFNLSTANDVSSEAGGTPRYMSPEQLQRLDDPKVLEDERSDLYSLGILFFEIATGRHPFNIGSISTRAPTTLIAARRVWKLRDADWPPAMPPAVRDIIGKLLEFDPLNRYQSAEQLNADITRQLNRLPLLHNRNRSVRERVEKWNARHPRLSAATVVGSVLGAALLLLISVLMLRQEQIAKLATSQWLTQVKDAQLPAQALLSSDSLPVVEVQKMLSHLNDDWVSVDALQKHRRHLTDSQIGSASQLLGQLYSYRARGKYELSLYQAEEDASKDLLLSAHDDTLAAARLLEIGQSENGELTEAIDARLNDDKSTTSIATAIIDKLETPAEMVSATEKLVQLDVANPWYWWNLGNQRRSAGDNQGALTALEVSLLLSPGFSNSRFLESLIELELSNFEQADAILNDLIDEKAITESSQAAPELFLNRGIARLALGRAQQALDDFSTIENYIHRFPRMYFLREQAKRLLGDIAGADADLHAGIAATPKDAIGWASRGDAKTRIVPADPQGALQDLKIAQQIDPNLLLVYDNQAFIFSEILDQRKNARDVLTDGIAQHPFHAGFYASRGVLAARDGDLDAAKHDVDQALQLDRSPMVCYQCASALLIGASVESDHETALQLLKETLNRQPSLHAMMANDVDLASIRNSAGFLDLLNAARTLQ